MQTTLIDQVTRGVMRAIQRTASSRTDATLYDNGALLFDERSWNVREQFHDASDAEVRRAAAVSTGSEHLLIHHVRQGTVSFHGLRISMARLLTEDLPISDVERDAAYDHLAAHYRELGIEPPEPGWMDEDRAFELALEGRLAHLDDEGNAWVFAEPVELEDEGRFVAGFVAVDGGAVKLCEPPWYGHLAEPRFWGGMGE